MTLETMLNNVLPEGSVLYKHNHGFFDFYKSDRHFEDGDDFSSQDSNETFSSFIERTVQELMAQEEQIGDPEPTVTIDYAINKSKP